MLKPMSVRLSALIAANFVAAAAVGLGACVLVGGYIAFTPPGSTNGVAAMIRSAIFFRFFAAVAGSVIAFPFFLVGLALVGIPTWWALHRVRWTSRAAFVAVAAIESALGGAVTALLLSPDAAALAWLLALPGGLAGWTIWRLGYDPGPGRERS